jgi:hypothetical protein
MYLGSKHRLLDGGVYHDWRSSLPAVVKIAVIRNGHA